MAKHPPQSEHESASGEQSAQAPEASQPILGRVSRRSFLSHLGAAGIAATAPPLLASAPPSPAPTAQEAGAAAEGATTVTLRVNGKDHRLEIDPRTTLHINGRRVNSCLSFAVMHSNEEITTIEGIGQPDHLHPMQAAFVEHDGYQCGYCTSGQIMSAVALLKEPVGPTDDDVKQAMYGNICRCGAYSNIVAAVQYARKQA